MGGIKIKTNGVPKALNFSLEKTNLKTCGKQIITFSESSKETFRSIKQIGQKYKTKVMAFMICMPSENFFRKV